jgi:hypothetical protein
VEAAGDHEVQDEEEVFVECEDDALADAAEGTDGLAFNCLDARDGCAEQEWRCYAEVFQWLIDDAGGEGGEIGRYVGEFRHESGRRYFILTKLVWLVEAWYKSRARVRPLEANAGRQSFDPETRDPNGRSTTFL